jgi:hypothetical protein
VTAVSATPDVNASTVPTAQRRQHRSGFWAAAFAFVIVMAVATLPSPLYGLYRTRDHLSALHHYRGLRDLRSHLLIALYVGLAVPVIGAGVALDLGASAPSTVLGFAILVGLGVVVSGWALLGTPAGPSVTGSRDEMSSDESERVAMTPMTSHEQRQAGGDRVARQGRDRKA